MDEGTKGDVCGGEGGAEVKRGELEGYFVRPIRVG